MIINVFLIVLFITSITQSNQLLAESSKAKVLNHSPKWSHSIMPNSPSLRGTAMVQKSMWVTGSNNSVFVSQDAGKTWINKSVPLKDKRDFRDIALFNNDTAIVMSAGTGELSALYITTDGGNHWQLLYQNTDVHGFFNSIAFWDEQQGLLMGDPVDGYYVIKKTTDGGKTWRRISIKNLPNILPKETAFSASGNSIIVGSNGQAWITTGGFSASVYLSNDYGETWRREPVPLYKSTQTAGGYAIALNHLEQPFVMGGDYLQRRLKYSNMASFTNEHWQPIKTGSAGLKTAMSCQKMICITTGKLATDISFDAGSSWQSLTHKQTNELAGQGSGFYSLASDDSVFLAAGAEGKVLVLSYQ